MFRLSGIFRDVYLWSAADIDLRDFEIKAGLADDLQTGTFNLDAIIDNRSDQSAEAKITITLTAPDGRIINAPPAAAVVPANGKSTTSISIENVGKVLPWSAEMPDLYHYHIVLSDASGKEIAHYAGKTGFRRNEVRDGQFLHNGQPVLIKGVNRHDHNPETGHYVTREDIHADLLAMKRANINAVRTAHYPNDPALLELCDEEKKPLTEQRPLIQCEYNHSMGNSTGNLADYWRLFREERLLQGGFIWDFKDLDLLHKKHATSDVEDRSERKVPLRLFGSLDPNEGLYGGGVLADSPDLTGSWSLLAEARINGPRLRRGSQPLISGGLGSFFLGISEDATRLECMAQDADETLSAGVPPPTTTKARNSMSNSTSGVTPGHMQSREKPPPQTKETTCWSPPN